MMRNIIHTLLGLLIAGSFFAAGNKPIDPDLKNRATDFIKNKPVKFVENKGHMTDMNGSPVPFVLFKAEAPGMNFYITEKGLTYCFFEADEDREMEVVEPSKTYDRERREVKWTRIDMELKGASIKREKVVSEGRSEYFNQYFLGNCPNGISDVHSYNKLTIQDVYQGIDWVFYNSDAKGFKYDFVVHPGADPDQIKLLYRSKKILDINEQGNIKINTSYGSLTEQAPVSYIAENKENIPTIFAIKNVNRCTRGKTDDGYEALVKFNLGVEAEKLKSQTIIIDPQLVWCTIFGGNDVDGFTAFDCDASGNLFVTGYTNTNPGFPVLNAGSYFQGPAGGGGDAFILKFSATGTLIWRTYYGGNGIDHPLMVNVDIFGNVFVVGQTTSTNFPVQNAGTYFQGTLSFQGPSGSDAFILKFNNAGVRFWATYFGGLSSEVAYGLATDASGNIFVSGWTASANFPTKNAGTYYQSGLTGLNLFILKFDNTGNHIWGTQYPGAQADGSAIAIDNSGNVFIAGVGTIGLDTFNSGTFFLGAPPGGGRDLFFLKFDNLGNRLWATYYGGSGTEDISGIVCDGSNIFINGITTSADFPLQNSAGSYYDGLLNGWSDGFILKFDNLGNRIWGTYFGGNNDETSVFFGGSNHSVLSTNSGDYDRAEVDDCGNVYAVFETDSPDISTINPGCSTYFKGTMSRSDIVIARFSNAGVLTWSSYIGDGNFRGPIAISPIDGQTLFVGGETYGALPFVNPGSGAYFDNSPNGNDDSFIARFNPTIPTYTKSKIDPTGCSVCNGSATVNVSNVCAGSVLNYVWSNGTQTLLTTSTSNTVTGLCPGNYSVTITETGCNATKGIQSFTLGGGAGNLTLNNTITNTSCKGLCNGSIAINPTGGVMPYTYVWNNSQTINAATGLCTGSYSVTVTDVNNCKSVQDFNVTEPSEINVGVIAQWVCPANLGSATALVSGGSPGYNYLWSNLQTGSIASGLVTGTYTVTITDSKSCIKTSSASVSVIPMVITTSSGNITCTQAGRASVTVTNGLAPFIYTWSNGGVTSAINGLAAGGYTVTITDGNGCTETRSFTITGSSSASATFTQSPGGTICMGTTVNFTNTGSTGAGSPYSWLINTIPTTTSVTGTTANFSYTFLSVGTYEIRHITTNSGCTASEYRYLTVVNCSSPTVTATGSSVCPGLCGTISSTGSGGIAPYTYSWSNGATTQNISPCPVSNTTYTVTIRDSGGNTSSSTAVVTVNPAISVTTTPTNITCNGGANGTALANPGSGTPSYTYSWSNGQTVQAITGLSAGNYTVTVTDNKGCIKTATATIVTPAPLGGQFAKGAANCTGCGCKEWLVVNATGGTSPYTYLWPDGYANRYKNQLCPGNYNVNIKDKNGCSVNINLSAP
ncbi:MAG: SBBP repeat-containing protein [Bacteroidetes bacterium]|nr:SBBP repeat-containing protein [Bacteroidota bacterium]